MALSNTELKHYQRQILLDEVGVKGQEKLKTSRVLVIGAGGLGCPALAYLAAAGVGTLGILDSDAIELHNLHRQILFTQDDLNQGKAETAARRLALNNPLVTFDIHSTRLVSGNADELISSYDLVVDGTDNFETRYAVNDACVRKGKTLVSGAIYKFEAQVAVFNYQGSADYRSLFPVPPASNALNCSINGVIGSTCAVVGGLMANEVLKLILGIGTPLAGTLLTMDLLSMELNKFSINPSSRTQHEQSRPQTDHAS